MEEMKENLNTQENEEQKVSATGDNKKTILVVDDEKPIRDI